MPEMHMPHLWYLIAVLAIGFVITVALRALPFAVLTPLRRSQFIKQMSVWMPVGILAILAASTLVSTADGSWRQFGYACGAVAVTAAVHLLAGRHTLLSVGAGTLTYVLLVNLA